MVTIKASYGARCYALQSTCLTALRKDHTAHTLCVKSTHRVAKYMHYNCTPRVVNACKNTPTTRAKRNKGNILTASNHWCPRMSRNRVGVPERRLSGTPTQHGIFGSTTARKPSQGTGHGTLCTRSIHRHNPSGWRLRSQDLRET